MINEKWERTLEKMLEADKNSPRVIEWTNEMRIEDIQACERFYKKSTKDFLMEFEDREYEGNVDERQWYRFAKILLNEGYELKDISIYKN